MSDLTRRTLLTTALAAAAQARPRPAPYGPVPTPRQIAWQKLELYSFLHFTVNTFTDKEWGYGDESPALFNPTAFDADAICGALRDGGMRAVILTCKHHDGFCLWPTRTTEHSVRNSPWRGGKGDVVKEIAEAAARHGLKFGVYLSPWDRNCAFYAKPEYVRIYREQLRELLTGYGPIYEVWHDGANGGDGYYGGAREKRTIDKRTYYDWGPTWDLVRQLQPGACIFSDVGPDIRWVGNERGLAGEPCWATYTPTANDGGPGYPGDSRYKEATNGHRDGKLWLPAECDVSIRPGWFWHESQNSRVKTPEQLTDLYFQSVGRGATLLLNIPPDRRGLLHENDVASLRGFREKLDGLFKTDLAKGAKVKFARKPADEVTIEFRRPVKAGIIRLREHTPLGQRVDRFSIDAWQDGGWKSAVEAQAIGASRLIRLDQPVTTPKLRLRILEAKASLELEEFAVFEG